MKEVLLGAEQVPGAIKQIIDIIRRKELVSFDDFFQFRYIRRRFVTMRAFSVPWREPCGRLKEGANQTSTS